MMSLSIGNPPYQDTALGNNITYAPPIMEEAYIIANKVSLITPARFLFNAGSTPKLWNEKMLSDEHLKIVFYEANSVNVFPNTGIAGRVVVTYVDTKLSTKRTFVL
ncbi:restriction endonuclease [Streptococcus mutans SF12]|nr:restriction endonuclease [Streptococcus mutans SF12]